MTQMHSAEVLKAVQQFLKAQPTLGDVHVNAALNDISIAFMQDPGNFIAERLFPVVPVTKQADRYFTYPKDNWFRVEAQKRAPGAESAGGGYELTTDTYFADVYAIHKDVPDQIRSNADPAVNPDNEATLWSTEQCMLIRELVVLTQFFVTGVWGTEVVGVTGVPAGGQFQFWNEAGSVPITDLEDGIISVESQTGRRPNTLTLGARVWSVLKNHPDFIARVNSGQTPGGPALVSRQRLAEILEIDEVLVTRAVQNTALEGATATIDYMAGNHALLTHKPASPGLLTPSAGYIFGWTGFLGAGAFGNRMSQFRLPQLQSDRIECELAFDAKLVAAELGYFLLGAVA